MDGLHASGLEELSTDIAAIDDGRFWAIVATFEGEFQLARFGEVHQSNFSSPSPWRPITDSWRSSFSKEEYCRYVEQIREAIRSGHVYQVNACRIMEVENHENRSLSGLMSRILDKNPAPFASYLSLPDWEIASASPERFLEVNNGEVMSSPIKGTSKTAEFLDKDRAENLMIVDLIRNDLSRFAIPGTVATPRLLGVEAHPGLFHLVSDVSGGLDSKTKLSSITAMMLPPGSVSGAPKSSALSMIHHNEGVRGPYCGALGFAWQGRLKLSVGIRTFWQQSDQILKFGTGAGITWGSDPLEEWEETELKASRLIGLTR